MVKILLLLWMVISAIEFAVILQLVYLLGKSVMLMKEQDALLTKSSKELDKAHELSEKAINMLQDVKALADGVVEIPINKIKN